MFNGQKIAVIYKGFKVGNSNNNYILTTGTFQSGPRFVLNDKHISSIVCVKERHYNISNYALVYGLYAPAMPFRYMDRLVIINQLTNKNVIFLCLRCIFCSPFGFLFKRIRIWESWILCIRNQSVKTINEWRESKGSVVPWHRQTSS